MLGLVGGAEGSRGGELENPRAGTRTRTRTRTRAPDVLCCVRGQPDEYTLLLRNNKAGAYLDTALRSPAPGS